MRHKRDHYNYFMEMQPFSRFWVTFSVIIVSAFIWYLFILQVIFATPLGNYPLPDPLLWSLFGSVGVFLPLFIFSIRMVVEVKADRLVVFYFPLFWRSIHFYNIESFEVIDYDPANDYGGWGLGIRWIPGKGWAYPSKGLKGVMITLLDGKRILVGSKAPGKLFESLKDRVLIYDSGGEE